MDIIHVLSLSQKSGFSKKVRDSLSSYSFIQVNHLASPSAEIPATIKNTNWVGLVDISSYSGSLEEQVSLLLDTYSGNPLVLVSDHNYSVSQALPLGFYLIDKEALESSLLYPFIEALHKTSALIQDKTLVEDNLNKRLSELQLIRKASLHLTMNLSLDSVLEAILDSAMGLVSADDTHIFLYDHGVISFAAAVFNGQQQRTPFMDPRPNGLTYQVAREGTKIVVDNTLDSPLFEDRPWEGSIISLPLKIGNKVLGVMNVALQRAHTFSEYEIRALEFLADQASIAIQNANLYEQAQQEIADRKKAEKAIKHLANHDALTGLPNRRLFNERINLEISRSQRNKQKIGVMLFDLDQLKKVNDSFGHNVGDILLQSVAQRLLGLLRKSDTVARMGGDEFLLILPEMVKNQDAILTAERILVALSTPFHLEGYEINITTSIGIAFFPDDGTVVEDLVKKADIAMYKAKEKGGNVYHIYTA